jgi:hypothetical protein
VAFAPHTNDDVRAQLRAGIIPTPQPILLGSFFHSETNTLFEFAERRHPDDAFAPEMPHVIYVGPFGTPRLAKVFKTVAYVVVNEDENGPVIEKWPIKQFRPYDTEWVRA